MNLIAAVDKNWAIGYQNKLLTSIPEDMKFFRQTTTGKVVVMGRKTLESFPGKKPLKNRTNIVLTKNPSYQAEGAIVVHNEDELWEELKKYDSEDIFVIGGESIYRQLLMCIRDRTRRISQRSSMRIPQTRISRISMRKRNGRSRRRVRSTPALILNISFSLTRKTRKKRAVPG